MAGYSARQSSFSSGDTITAAHSNDEFNTVLAAFNVSTGHTHDGSTAGDGGPISNLFSNALVFGTNANTDIAIIFNATSNDGVLTWMEDEDYFQFSDDILLTTTEKLQFRDTAVYINSSADGQLDLVADTEIQIAATTVDINGAVDISGNLGVGGNLTVTGTTTFNGGTLTLGDADTDNIVFGGEVDSDIIPDDDGAFDLGSSSKEWKDLFIDGTANIDSLVADTADINGGTIDGAVIGGASAAAITGTAITGTSFVIGSADISEAELETIDGVTAGTVSVSKAVVVDANKDIAGFRNINLTGELDAATLDISGNADIDGTLETDALSINGTAVTSTATELNLLDGKAFLDEDNMASNSATGIASQQSIKAYVDAQITAEDLDITTDSGTIAIDLDSETLTVSGGTGLDSSATGNAVTLAIDSTVATLTGSQTLTNKSLTTPTLTGTAVVASLDISGDIDVDGTTNLDVVDIDGAVDMASTLTVAGAAILNGGIDIVGNLTIDVDGSTITLADGGVNFGQFYNNASGTFNIVSPTESKDIVFRGDDDGTPIVALTLDMSNAGAATFNDKITAVGTSVFTNLDISGDVDIDGTLEADAITIGGTAIGSIYSAIAGSSSIVTTGALNSGSITSGFGAINNGSSDITTTGTVNFGSLADGTITVTAFVDEDDMSTNSATLVPTQQSVKAYADTKATPGFAVAMAIAL